MKIKIKAVLEIECIVDESLYQTKDIEEIRKIEQANFDDDSEFFKDIGTIIKSKVTVEKF